LAEKHNIYIQFNIAGNNVVFSEKELSKLPMAYRDKLLGAIPHEISETDAQEIIES